MFYVQMLKGGGKKVFFAKLLYLYRRLTHTGHLHRFGAAPHSAIIKILCDVRTEMNPATYAVCMRELKLLNFNPKVFGSALYLTVSITKD